MQNATNKKMLNDLQFQNLFNSSLIKNLPYLFWMYELIDNDYKLIKWNKNQEIFTEYSAEELYHMNALDFFDEKGKENIKNSIANVFKQGKSIAIEKIITKTGKIVPYYFEGYQFNLAERQIFIGISVDISQNTKTLRKLQLSEKEKRILFDENSKNKEQLLNLTAQIFQNNKSNNILDRQVNKILESDNIDYIKNELIQLKKIIKTQQNTQETWESFNSRLDASYHDLITKLKIKHPNLTKSELRFCMYIKIQIPITELASVLNISMEGIRKKKYRIRKKINLKSNDSLKLYISNL